MRNQSGPSFRIIFPEQNFEKNSNQKDISSPHSIYLSPKSIIPNQIKTRLMKKDILTSIFIGALTFGALHVIKRLWRRYLRPIRKYTTIDLIGNTPLLYLKELSKLTKCEIYVKDYPFNSTNKLCSRLSWSI